MRNLQAVQGKSNEKETPKTAFSTTSADQDPMRNFGYTVGAYSVLWFVLLAFLVLSWRKQVGMDNRIAELEQALDKLADDQEAKG
jgi:hypothetical protein